MNYEKQYWIFADESIQEDRYFSNFFGGCIIPACLHAVEENRLRIHKAQIGFLKELKWQRVSEMWLDGYRHILAEVRTLKPALNPKISTACEPFPEGGWSMPYRHWSFKPRTTQ